MFSWSQNGNTFTMRKTFYAVIGWFAWRRGRRRLERKLRFGR
jgi:hypothetical protein